jgi:hypothetical protein
MEVFTLNRNFQKEFVIDEYASIIWTERYYGDSEVELTTALDSRSIERLPVGTFLGIDKSDEVMILETANPEAGKVKLKGISLLPWMDNRFVRASAAHEDRYLYLTGPPGQILWLLLYYFTNPNSQYLNGTVNIGIPNASKLAIPGIVLGDYDKSGNVTVGIPYGPLYKAMRELATTYEIGMKLTLDDVTSTSYSLGFRSYVGIDRTSTQNVNPLVRFSPDMETFTNIKEVQSIAAMKTLAYTFAPSNPGGLATTAGVSQLTGDQYTGFDLRAMLEFEEDITTDQVGSDPNVLLSILNSRADNALNNNRFVQAVDGEIVPESQIKYGIHYNLGDLIEVQGNSGAVNPARVTEYIRSQDETGEKSYPTVTVIS